MPETDERALGCFTAGAETKQLFDATRSFMGSAEHGYVAGMRDHLFYVSSHAGTLSTVLKGRERAAAAELSGRAKELRGALKGRKKLSESDRKSYENEAFGMMARSDWLDNASKAHCGDRFARQAVEKGRIPPLAERKRKG